MFNSPVNNAMRAPRIIALALVIFLTFSVAFGIYKKTSIAKAPPVYDALSYYEKAINTWNCITPTIHANPFYASPGSRPPGSVPVTAPFGVNISEIGFQWFYFRNLLVPFILWLGACFLVFPDFSKSKSDAILGVTFACSISLFPMFFNMEPNPETGIGYWGLQDTLLAAVAALALSLLIRGLKTQSALETLAAFFLSGYTLWIKPAGIIVVMIILAYWITEVAMRSLLESRSPSLRNKTNKYIFRCFPPTIIILAFFCGMALHSTYITKETIANATEAQAAVRMMYEGKKIEALFLMINRSIGFLWAFVFLIITGISGYSLVRKVVKCKILFAIQFLYFFIVLAAAFFWWYKISGPEERYFFPFVLLSVIGMGHPIWNYFVDSITYRQKATFTSIFLFMAGFSVLLLIHGNPHPQLESFLGINLRSGGYLNSIAAGQYIAKISEIASDPIICYIPEPDYDLGYIESILSISKRTSKARTANITYKTSRKWQIKNFLQSSDFLKSDIILLNCNTLPNKFESTVSLDTFDREMDAVKFFLNSVGSDEGVKKSHFSNICVIEVEDRAVFKKAFSIFTHKYKWRDAFYNLNPQLF